MEAMAWMVALPISTQESMEKVQPHGLVAPPLRLFTQSDGGLGCTGMRLSGS
jgi:hypothetical protein